MKILLSWVRDFVEIAAPADDIAATMALRGFEVASVEPLGGDDAVIDFEVTANRPDCLSVLGFAREIAATYQLPLRLPGDPAAPLLDLADIATTGAADELRVSIEDDERCGRFTAAVARVTPASSPAWMTDRLQASGVRPISPFVDITNYVLMELGQPMHAYDLEQLEGRQLVARRARPGEPLTTLDGVSRTLDADALVIADAARAQGVAGVMGGGASEVSGATQRVAFESAWFQPASVRRTSRRLGLKTEASARFERGTDINGPLVALRRALALMRRIGAGTVNGGLIDVYPAPRGPRPITLRRAALARLLGLAVPDTDVVRILRALGLTVRDVADDGWSVDVPTVRVDLLREVDLIEEVGRHYGFDRLAAAFPPMTEAAAPQDPRVARDRFVRRILAGAGLNEAVTFGFIEGKVAEAFVPDAVASDLVAVANPLSAQFDVLRPSLLPGLLAGIGHNRRHGRRDVGLFEIGARFTRSAGESRGVAFAWTGSAAPEHWSGHGREVDFFDAKGVVEQLCAALGVSVTFESWNDSAFLVAGQAARVMADGQLVGVAGVMQAPLLERASAPRADRVVAAELSLDRLEAARRSVRDSITPLPRFPQVVRDVSIVVGDALPAATIRATILSAAGGQGAPLVAVAFFDRYQGKGVPDGSVSLSARLTFQATDRTLTDHEVQRAFDHILSALVREHGAVQR